MINDLEKKILVLENAQQILLRHDETSKSIIQNITAFLTSLSNSFESEMKEDVVPPKMEVDANTVNDKEMQRLVVKLDEGVAKLKMENTKLKENVEKANQASNRTTRYKTSINE